MKKTFLPVILILMLLCFTACSSSDNVSANVNSDRIQILSVSGGNEQIYLNLAKPADGNFVISYKATGAEEYTALDQELIVENDDSLWGCIVGIPKGQYDVKIELGEGENYACTTLCNIDVEKQDRSGYVHFNREEGIGGYNNDGTVKEGAKILYLTNENKNTLTLDINGTTYTGLVEILRANQYMEEPLIIRVLGKITTNYWEDNITVDGLNVSDPSEYANLLSDKYGENLAGLPILPDVDEEGNVLVATPDGLTLSTIVIDSRAYVAPNDIQVENASNITIEGIGTEAMFYRFGIHFWWSDSIEVKNLTFEAAPTDGLGFYGFGEFPGHGWYWIHNNTFNGAAGDEPLDFAEIGHVTIAYNKFIRNNKAMLLGGWEYDHCWNMTIHHNHYYKVTQRLPLSRNSNIHNYNNYYENCGYGISPRSSSYVFNEANYFWNIGEPYYSSGEETWGVVKSWNDIYVNSTTNIDKATIVTDRDEIVENICFPDGSTDYSKFDTDPDLFYYDAENHCSDVEVMLDAEDVPAFVRTHAGAGVLAQVDIPE